MRAQVLRKERIGKPDPLQMRDTTVIENNVRL